MLPEKINSMLGTQDWFKVVRHCNVLPTYWETHASPSVYGCDWRRSNRAPHAFKRHHQKSEEKKTMASEENDYSAAQIEIELKENVVQSVFQHIYLGAVSLSGCGFAQDR